MEQGSAWWAAELLSAVIVALVLSRHPLRGALSDTANLTVVVAIVLLLMAEGIFAYTTVGGHLRGASRSSGPFSLVLMGAAIAARIIAPCVLHPLNLWLVIYAFLAFWLHTAMWTSELSFVEPPFTWALALTGLALVARWIAGRGFDGPILSPLNMTVAVYVYLLSGGWNTASTRAGSGPIRGATRSCTGPGSCRRSAWRSRCGSSRRTSRRAPCGVSGRARGEEAEAGDD